MMARETELGIHDRDAEIAKLRAENERLRAALKRCTDKLVRCTIGTDPVFAAEAAKEFYDLLTQD